MPKHMMTLSEYIEQMPISDADLKKVEAYLDAVFAKLGIDVEFGKHFKDRLNDARNGKQISKTELINLFTKEYERYGKVIAQMGPDKEALLTDLSSDVNTPIILKWNRGTQKLEMAVKTIMRKKNFKPNDSREKHFKVT
jgi:hypothetical protein